VPETDIGSEDRAATTAAGAADGPGSRLAAHEHAGRSRTWRGWGGWLVIAIPAVTSFVVGGYEIGLPPLWRDEAVTKDAIGRPVSQIFALLGHVDAVHGAYYVLMHFTAAAVGTSDMALRFPSLCAMVVATAFTAATGRRTGALAQAPGAGQDGRISIPALTGLLSGMVFATAPLMVYYAQMARPYAFVTMFAAIASYLLLRAYPDGRWRWWSAYGAAVALTGLFNLFGLLIVAAHGLTLLLTDARGQASSGRRLGRIPLRWLAVSLAAVILLAPLLRVALGEQAQIGWMIRPPDSRTIIRLFRGFAGSTALIGPFVLLALGGIAAGCIADRWRPLNPAALALPWLTVPPALLITASFIKPVYNLRYVAFCLPALAILAAAGLAGLIRLASSARIARLGVAWMPAAIAALVTLGLAAMLVKPLWAVRQTLNRTDNLRLASAIVAAHERPGDVVFYIPAYRRVFGTGYPAPFQRLRDIALAQSAIASVTLTGTEITSLRLLKSRFTGVRRVWVVTNTFPVPSTPVDREKMALLTGMHIVHRWLAGEVMLTLYQD
jgi:mannosyltransferase